MPLSNDPESRKAQLSNLRRGDNPAPAGNGYGLVHGERTARPQGGPEWSPAMALTLHDLEERVDGSLRDDQGELLAWALPSVEAVAIQRVACERLDRFVAGQEAKGKLTPEHLDTQSRVGERYHRALEREALTLRSRIEARGQAFDLARHWQQEGGDDG